MINLRSVYRSAEEHTTLIVVALFGVLALLIILQSVFSLALVLGGLGVVMTIVCTMIRPVWMLGLLAWYLPFETIVLKYLPSDLYALGKYGAESLIYLVVLIVLYRVWTGSLAFRSTHLDLPIMLFVLCLLGSAIIHMLAPSIAILGMRQILRFVIVFFLVVQLQPSRTFISRLTLGLFVIVFLQSLLGISQAIIGQPLDLWLLPGEDRVIGNMVVTEGVEQFWDPGSRVFGTLGRYDRLGNFLYVVLALATGYLFTPLMRKKYPEIVVLFLLAIPTLLLTYSRASWFAFLLGFLTVGYIIKRDSRVIAGFAVLVFILASNLAVSGLNVGLITESAGQTLNERFYESFSLARWRGEYFGLGRVYWFVQTLTTVFPASPLFGFGPGQYGGGAATALKNTQVYEQLGLPFGVFGTEGFIDNNWFSLLGETGLLGMIFYLLVYGGVFRVAWKNTQAKDPFVQALALGVVALMIGVAFNAWTSTVLEIRTVAFYLWLYAGFLWVEGSRRIGV